MKKIWIVVRKEWWEIFKNRLILYTMLLLPLIFSVMPLFILYSVQSAGSIDAAAEAAEMPKAFAALCQGMEEMDCLQFFILSQFLMMFLITPAAIPVMISAHSVVGEKKTRTLEAVLATPITTLELLLGKALAAIIPALGACWFSYLVFVVGAYLMHVSPAVMSQLVGPTWLLAILVISPLIAIAGVSLSVMVSSRVNEPRAAEQFSAMIVLPFIGLMMAQTFGLVLINASLMFWLSLGVLALDCVLVYLTIQIFQRETILTRWK